MSDYYEEAGAALFGDFFEDDPFTNCYIAKWPDGDVSLVVAATPGGLFDALDEFGDPGVALVRPAPYGTSVNLKFKGMVVEDEEDGGPHPEWALDEMGDTLALLVDELPTPAPPEEKQ